MIGICWAGRPTHENDKNRSCPVHYFMRLLDKANITLVSLQRDQSPPSHDCMIDCSALLTDFSKTAALIKQCDLIITVDTVIAHLAGSLGKPTWIILPFVPDWRWLLDREDSPWYNSVRLFRQHTHKQWDDVFERVATALDQVIHNNNDD